MNYKGDLFPLAFSERRHIPRDLGNLLPTHKSVRVQGTGEFRPPRKGEWFLSGAIIEGYRAHNDLDTSYYIAIPVLVRTEEVVVRPLDK